MFERLVASTVRAPDARRLGVVAVSVVVHAGIVAAALGAEPAPAARPSEPLVWDIADLAPASPASPAMRAAGSSGGGDGGGVSRPAVDAPPAPGAIPPDDLPPIDAELAVPGAAQGLRDVRGAAGAGPAGPLDVGSLAGGGPAADGSADLAPELLAMPEPRYPAAMKALGVEGWVVLELVVGAAGRVDPASVTVREASDSAFVPAAREAVLAARFAPGRRAGRAVPVRASQRIVFRITPR